MTSPLLPPPTSESPVAPTALPRARPSEAERLLGATRGAQLPSKLEASPSHWLHAHPKLV